MSSSLAQSIAPPDRTAIKPLRIGPLIIDPPVLQAPMAGFTNYAFRQIVREYGGAGLQATEMVSARAFAWMSRAAEHPDRLWGVKDEPRPLAVQMWDNDPETLAEVGRRLVGELGVSVVDLNFGCPVKQVTQAAHSGSYLLRFPEQVGKIVSRVVAACAPTPVTAKIRLGCTRESQTAAVVARAIEEAGAAALTVHGRVAADFFKGSADWEAISQLKSQLRSIPLIGNGDLDSPEKVLRAFSQYHVDGVMIARACLGRPWLFAQVAAALKGLPVPPDPTLSEQRDCLLRHYDLVVERFGVERGTMLMRKFACCYAQGRRGCRMFRSAVVEASTPAEFHAAVEQYFPREETEQVAPGESTDD